jgi:hypothetical protein
LYERYLDNRGAAHLMRARRRPNFVVVVVGMVIVAGALLWWKTERMSAYSDAWMTVELRSQSDPAVRRCMTANGFPVLPTAQETQRLQRQMLREVRRHKASTAQGTGARPITAAHFQGSELTIISRRQSQRLVACLSSRHLISRTDADTLRRQY